jgi:peptide deformylase
MNTTQQQPEANTKTWDCQLVEPNHPVLHQPADLDPFQSDIDWHQQEKQMLSLMHSKLGVGLAAPQVGLSYRVFVMTHSTMGNIGIYNPEILETQGEVQIEEGCLSWPMLYLHLRRPQRVRVRYTTTDGQTQVDTWLDGMDARCFLHEYDHLEGVNFIDLASELKLRRAKDKRDKFFKKLDKIGKR